MKKLLTPTAVRGVNYATSPLLASKTPNWRSRFLVAAVALGFAGLLLRAAQIQLVKPEYFQKEGEKRYAHSLEVPATRGRVLDRSGQLLATSVPVPSVWAIPKDLKATPEQRRQLARLLGMDDAELNQRLASGSASFAWLKRQVDTPTWDQIAKLGIKGVYQSREFRRRYPEGESAAHVVGFTNLEDQGQEGVELAFQRQLQGRNGTRGVVKDRLGRVIEDMGTHVEPADGSDIALSVDAKVQFFAYQRVREAVAEHKAKAGSVVVLDVQTGEILALANYPSYDPGERGKRTGEQLRNRALTDIFEPGSTMKPFVVAWALETGKVKPETPINASAGSVVVSGIAIKDAHHYGTLSVREVIQKSSNIGTVRMAMQMQPRELWELYASVGYGQKPQISFPGAVSGRLRPYKTWRPIEQATMSYGYGLSASLLQIARAYTTFARDGEVIPITMLRQEQPVSGIRVISPETAREIRTMLQMAAAPGGTGTLAQTIGYSVGGKSGTAHKQEGKGYASNKYRSWFVGLAPIDKPRIVVAVMVDEPSNGKYYGGAVAAPVFSQVVQQTLRTLGVPPDLDVKPRVVAKAVPDAPESF
ncbi:peptidoglycan D,D-transpeptidase FtsI family protein [Pseudaquabacterium pictum]|uniref:Peptidoglycan D,D-transpeptidase FtsI n=1 Tax=Pseudaquabacterium pictum TaxID=2315236 RepID=A0A480AWC8_9BURK|nr:penicillin-binding protein 2 [Rubrivivax pictus]GCL64095.1 peptidoglycan synthetase FtsI [Rubrivivax pictus]